MDVHLVDGTYEIFRYHFALPSHLTSEGREVAATRGVVGSMLGLLEDGATHVGIATDHVIESFRNDLWQGYKSSAGMPPELLGQFGLLEDALEAAGFTVFPMVEYEADDAMAAAAAVAAADARVDRVWICTPDKDLGQCVVGDRVVQLDRRKGVMFDAAGVQERFGVAPSSIPDYLALVGDSADGFPGLAGWGAKSAAGVLATFPHLEDIPAAATDWGVSVRGAAKLAATLQSDFDLALLFRRIATVELDAPTVTDVEELRWTGPTAGFRSLVDSLDAPNLAVRAEKLATTRQSGG
ncbi:MAG TPA: 5'-3' exonuclease H3TH domain-containing protein [Acidimicrobiales bacterium]